MSIELATGMRVVCINGYEDGSIGYGDEAVPKTGAVYTVRDVALCRVGGECLWLQEIQNPKRFYKYEDDFLFGEPGFPVDRFRPLDESRLDVFRSLLTPVVTREVVSV